MSLSFSSTVFGSYNALMEINNSILTLEMKLTVLKRRNASSEVLWK